MLGTFSLFHSLLRDCIYIKSILVCIHVAVVGGILHIAHLNTVFFLMAQQFCHYRTCFYYNVGSKRMILGQ